MYISLVGIKLASNGIHLLSKKKTNKQTNQNKKVEKERRARLDL